MGLFVSNSKKLKTFKIGVFDSVANLNVGNLATLHIYDALGIDR